MRLQEKELEDHFYKFGRLASLWIARNPPGFAYVVSSFQRGRSDTLGCAAGYTGYATLMTGGTCRVQSD